MSTTTPSKLETGTQATGSNAAFLDIVIQSKRYIGMNTVGGSSPGDAGQTQNFRVPSTSVAPSQHSSFKGVSQPGKGNPSNRESSPSGNKSQGKRSLNANARARGTPSNAAAKKKAKVSMKSPNKKNRAQFVTKLFHLLNKNTHNHILSWYGGGFVIWDRIQFVSVVLPMLFNHQKYSSFERQMNFYSFSKMAVNDDFPSKRRMKKTEPIKWKHRLFHKDTRLEDVLGIKRSTDPGKIEELKTSLSLAHERNDRLRLAIQDLMKTEAKLTQELESLPNLEAGEQIIGADGMGCELGPDIFDIDKVCCDESKSKAIPDEHDDDQVSEIESFIIKFLLEDESV